MPARKEKLKKINTNVKGGSTLKGLKMNLKELPVDKAGTI